MRHRLNRLDGSQHNLRSWGQGRWIKVPHNNTQSEIGKVESSHDRLSHDVGWWKEEGNRVDRE